MACSVAPRFFHFFQEGDCQELGEAPPPQGTPTARGLVKQLDKALVGRPEDLNCVLQELLRQLTTAEVQPPGADGGGSPPPSEGEVKDVSELVDELLAADSIEKLLMNLEGLDFEAQKGTARLFEALLRRCKHPGTDTRLVAYIRDHPGILQLLFKGCERPEVFWQCALMLRCCAWHPQLVPELHQERVAYRLVELAAHQSFDVASEAFCSLRELLMAQRSISATWLAANSQEFFAAYHGLLHGQDYVTQRQALRLLSELLLDRSFVEVMISYVEDERYLQIHMNLLRDESKAIRVEAFHIFKIFVANPRKPRRIQLILYRNRDGLGKLLETFGASRKGDKGLAHDLATVMQTLQALEPPKSISPRDQRTPAPKAGR